LSLAKIQSWVAKDGRHDPSKERSPRELEVLDKFCRIAMDLSEVVPHQQARAGKGGAHHDLQFGRMVKGRKTPVVFCGILFKPKSGQFERRNDIATADAVRVYLKLSAAGGARGPWKDWVHDDDGLKPEPEWRYVEIPPEANLAGDELLNLLEDAYFEVVGI
jgi:hypothetical protein